MDTTLVKDNYSFDESSVYNHAKLIYKNSKFFSFFVDLQNTTTLSNLVKLFLTSLDLDGVIYKHPKNNILYSFGNKTEDKLSYNLSLQKEKLGDIAFYKKSKFDSKDIQEVEKHLSIAVYALKNSLIYHDMLVHSLRDPLTGVANRSALLMILDREIHVASRYKLPFSIIALDFDDFKKINDMNGHKSGDFFLKSIVQSINDTLRNADILFRLGGDEFIILLNNTPITGAQCVGRRIIDLTSDFHINIDQHKFNTTVSLGICQLEKNDDPNIMLHRADQALYKAKSSGGNSFACL